jgi:phosphoglycolate phosphatase
VDITKYSKNCAQRWFDMSKEQLVKRFAVKGVILDLDGTLLHTLPDLVAAANAMLVEFGFAALPKAQIEAFIGKGAQDLVIKCLSAHLPAPQVAARQVDGLECFQRHYALLNGLLAEPFSGVQEGLDALRALGLRMACVTNKPHRFALPLLKQKGMAQYFEFILGADSLPTKKPDPGPFLWVAKQFGLPSAHVLAVGDSSNDALAARAAGMPSLLVPYGYNHGEPVDAVDCDGIVASLAQVASLITVPH